MPWYIIMAIEDGLSVMSFVVGLLYLHHTDGVSRALFSKRILGGAAHNETSASPA